MPEVVVLKRLAADESTAFEENNTNTTSNSGSSYELPFNDAWVITSACVLAVFFVFGVTANSITIAAIRSSPRLKSHYYSFLMSLCVSDILSAFVSILFLYRRTWGFDYFYLPEFFCRLYWGLDLWTSFSTALHILSFAVLRLIGARWPLKFRRISSFHIRIWIASVWIVTFMAGFIPHFLFNTVNDIDRKQDVDRAHFASCSLSPDWISTWKIYVLFSYAFFLYIPALSIIGISISIAVLLRKHRIPPGEQTVSTVSGTVLGARILYMYNTNNTNSPNVTPQSSPSAFAGRRKLQARQENAAKKRWRKDKQAIYQLFLIVGSFLLGYIPLTAFHFFTVFIVDTSCPAINVFDWQFAMVQYILLRFSECLNPIFYNAVSKTMRDATLEMLKRTFHVLRTSRERQPAPRPRASPSDS